MLPIAVRSSSFILMCCALNAHGQVNFMKSYGGPATEVCNDLVLRADGSIAMVGETQTAAYVFGSSDGFLLRSDLNGVILNAAASGAAQVDAYTSVEALPDSGLFAVGYTSNYGANFLDFTVTRLNKNNGIVWSRRVGGPRDDLPLGTALTHDGGIVIAGNYGITTANTEIYITKVSGTGALVWTRAIAAAGYDLGFSIERTPDDGFIVCGESDAFGPNAPHIFVAKLTSAGVVTWRQVLGTPQEDHGTCALPTPDGGYILSGYTFRNAANSGDVFLCKLTSTGTVSWFRTYGDVRYQVASDMVLMPDGSFWVTGTSSFAGFGNPDIFLIHASSTGALLSAKEYGQPSRTERGNALRMAPDGGFLIGGDMYECPTNQFEALLVRTLPGGFCPTCDTTNVVYGTSAGALTTYTGFTLSTPGTASAINPMIQSVTVSMTLCSADLTLPIELLAFNGEARGAGSELWWSTASELNNDHFDLQRSADGVEWGTFATVTGAGTSHQRIDYGAVDRAPFALTYYRLKQVDTDGASTLSDVIALSRGSAAGEVLLYPNPATDELHISLPDGSGTTLLTIIAVDGRKVYERTVVPAEGRATLLVDVRDLPVGAYSVVMRSVNETMTARWIKALL